MFNQILCYFCCIWMKWLHMYFLTCYVFEKLYRYYSMISVIILIQFCHAILLFSSHQYFINVVWDHISFVVGIFIKIVWCIADIYAVISNIIIVILNVIDVITMLSLFIHMNMVNINLTRQSPLGISKCV